MTASLRVRSSSEGVLRLAKQCAELNLPLVWVSLPVLDLDGPLQQFGGANTLLFLDWARCSIEFRDAMSVVLQSDRQSTSVSNASQTVYISGIQASPKQRVFDDLAFGNLPSLQISKAEFLESSREISEASRWITSGHVDRAEYRDGTQVSQGQWLRDWHRHRGEDFLVLSEYCPDEDVRAFDPLPEWSEEEFAWVTKFSTTIQLIYSSPWANKRVVIGNPDLDRGLSRPSAWEMVSVLPLIRQLHSGKPGSGKDCLLMNAANVFATSTSDPMRAKWFSYQAHHFQERMSEHQHLGPEMAEREYSEDELFSTEEILSFVYYSAGLIHSYPGTRHDRHINRFVEIYGANLWYLVQQSVLRVLQHGSDLYRAINRDWPCNQDRPDNRLPPFFEVLTTDHVHSQPGAATTT